MGSKLKETQNQKNRRLYKETKDIEKDMKDICLIVKSVLALKGKVNEKYIRHAIDKLLWDVTELDGKHNYKYKSNDLLESDNKDEHEHVFTKKYLIDKLIEHPKLCNKILGIAISCGVTTGEHKNKLKDSDKLVGWERYKDAGIKVWNMVGEKKKVDLDELIEEQNRKLEEIGIK